MTRVLSILLIWKTKKCFFENQNKFAFLGEIKLKIGLFFIFELTVHWTSWSKYERCISSLQKLRKPKDSELFSKPQCRFPCSEFLDMPHFLGILNDSEEDREGYVQFWAVIGSLLGIKEFNMCLHRIEVVEMLAMSLHTISNFLWYQKFFIHPNYSICHIMNRYVLIPLLQIENNPTFIRLSTAYTEGMPKFIPFSSFETRLFLARRLAGVPGYQYEVDLKKEFIIRQILNNYELKSISNNFRNLSGQEYRKHMMFQEKMGE